MRLKEGFLLPNRLSSKLAACTHTHAKTEAKGAEESLSTDSALSDCLSPTVATEPCIGFLFQAFNSHDYV